MDSLKNRHIQDFWTTDKDAPTDEAWTGWTRFTLLREIPRKGHVWIGERQQRVQWNTSRPDNVSSAEWYSMSQSQKDQASRDWLVFARKRDENRALRRQTWQYIPESHKQDYLDCMSEAQAKYPGMKPSPTVRACKQGVAACKTSGSVTMNHMNVISEA